MYLVNVHAYGRPMNGNWELGLPKHAWEPVHSCRAKAEAIRHADGCEYHAIVTDARGSVIHDNGKEPHPNPHVLARS
jgi:hypothetical protein